MQSIKSAVTLLDASTSDMAVDNVSNTVWHLAASIRWKKLIRYLLNQSAGIEEVVTGRVGGE